MLSHGYHEALDQPDRLTAGSAQPRTCCGLRSRCSTTTRSTTAVLGALVFGGRSAIYRPFSVSNFWPEMNRTGSHDHLHAGHHGVPARPRRGPSRDAEVGRTRGEHDAQAPRRRALAGGGRQTSSRTASGCYDVQRGLRRDRGQPHLVVRRPGRRTSRTPPGVINDEYFDVRIFDDGDDEWPRNTRRRDRHPAEASPRDVRGLLGPARGPNGWPRAGTGGTTPVTSAGSTTTATSSSSTARPTTSVVGARTSRRSRSKIPTSHGSRLMSSCMRRPAR